MLGLSSTESPSPWGPEVPAATYVYLERAAQSLREAITEPDVNLRYAFAHIAALRATAALLAARTAPATSKRARSTQRNAWILLAKVAPEFAEWAAFFSAGAAKRAAAEAGSSRAVTAREADDLIRDADRFLSLIEESLGFIAPIDRVIDQAALQGQRAATSWAS